MWKRSNPVLSLAMIAMGAGQVAADPQTYIDAVSAAVRTVHEGDQLAAYRNLNATLARELASWQGSDHSEEAAHAELACLVLDGLVDELERAREFAQEFPIPEGLPPRVDFILRRLKLLGLAESGQIEAARALRSELGYLMDWQLVGPFDNERGVGMRSVYAPEEGIDLGRALPGKEREVAWRRVPEQGWNGRLNLDAMLRPAEQVVAYLATSLYVDEARSVVLRAGSTSPFAVLQGGERIFETDVERPLRDDQERIVLQLAAGWNPILIKTGVEEGRWNLKLRLTDLDGRPLGPREVRVDSARCSEAAPERSDRIARPGGEAIDILPALESDVAAQRAYTMLLLAVHPHDYTSDLAAQVAERAVQLDPEDPDLHMLHAQALYPHGRSRAEMAIGPHLAALEEVRRLDPDHVGGLLAEATFVSRLKPMPDRWGRVTARLLEVAPQSWRAVGARIDYLESRDRDTEARLLGKQLSTFPAMAMRSAGLLMQVANERRAGRAEAAFEILANGFAQRPASGPLTREYLRELAERGMADELIAATERHLACRPDSVARRIDAAALLEGVAAEGRPAAGPAPEQAQRWVRDALAITPESPEALAWLARFAMRRGDQAEALQHLQAILTVEPGNDRVRRQVDWLSKDAAEARFEDPYRRDALDLVGTPVPESGGNDPLEALERTTVVRVYADGGESRYEHIVWRPLTQAGVSLLPGYGIVYPRGAQLYVHNVRVIRKDGSVERAPAPQGRDRTRGGLALRGFELPPVGVGDIVDVEYRIDETTPDVFGEYFGMAHAFYPDRLDSLAPTRRSQLVVIAPPELPIHTHQRNGDRLQHSSQTDTAGNVVYSWVVEGLRRPPMESAMPSASEFAPVVELSTYQSWQDFARWWWSFIEKEFDTTPAMREKVEELTAGLSTEAERVAAIYRFVAQEIRYNAWSFGTHGYEPFSASTIFERRFGDCKDKSILLRQMLAEVGVDAVPVLIQAQRFRPDEDLALARVGHFNHCIAYVTPTAERAGYYLDATADRNPIEYLRFDDQGAEVLHVTPEGGELHSIPYVDAEENVFRRIWTVNLARDASAEVQLEDRSSGQYAIMMRYRYGGERGDLAKTLGEELNEAFGNVEIGTVETSPLEQTDVPAWMKATFRAREIGTQESGQRRLRLQFRGLGLDGLAVEPPQERVFDLVLDRPFRAESVVRYLLPEGAALEALPPDVDIETEGLVRYRQQVRREGDRVEVTRSFELLAQRIESQDYARFQGALEEVRLAERRTLGWTLEATDEEAAAEGQDSGGDR